MTETGAGKRGRKRFRPTFWATVFTVPALAILLALGTWQVQRLHWKEGEIAKRQERSQGPGIALPADFPDPAGIEFTRVALSGRPFCTRRSSCSARAPKAAASVTTS